MSMFDIFFSAQHQLYDLNHHIGPKTHISKTSSGLHFVFMLCCLETVTFFDHTSVMRDQRTVVVMGGGG